MSLPFLPVSTWLLLQLLDYKIPLWLVFRCFFRVVIPQFICISNLVLGGEAFKIHMFRLYLEAMCNSV